MKRVIYKGLLALTIAFGVTSCDKNEMDDIAAPTVGVVANDDYSKLGFLENGVSIAPIKGRANDVASKNASEFTHFYGTGPQTLEISNNSGVVYTGSYTPNDITSLEPATIILANGLYDITTSNSADQSAVVLGFLPYTSSASVNLDASKSVTLQATLSRGFVIADAVRANDGGRITSVVLSQPAAGDEAAVSGELIEDADGDFHGYLVGGTYAVEINYLLDGSNSVVTGSVEITNGVAMTLDPELISDAPVIVVTSETTTSTQYGYEGSAEQRRSGDTTDYDVYSLGDLNSDLDLGEVYARIVSSTIVTTDGEAAPATSAEGAWILESDGSGVTVNGENNDGISQSGVTTRTTRTALAGTEAALALNVPARGDGGDINDDDDILDTLTRMVTTLYTTTDGTEDAGVITSRSPWSIVVNNAPVDAVDAGSDTISYDGVFVINDDRTEGASTGSVFIFDESEYATLALAQAAADAVSFSSVVNIIERESFADDTYTETQGFSVVVVDIVDDPAPEADASLLTQDGSEANADVDTDVAYTTAADTTPVAAEWTTSTVSLELYGIIYVTLYSNTDFSLDFVIDIDPNSGTISYQLVDSSLSGNAQAIGDLVPADSVEAAIAAAKLAIAAI